MSINHLLLPDYVKYPSEEWMEEIEAVIDQSNREGWRKPTGYIQTPHKLHSDFRSNGGDPNNDYSRIGNGELDAIIITDSDLDGITGAALARHKYAERADINFTNHGDSSAYHVLREVADNDPAAPIHIIDNQPEGHPANWRVIINRLDVPVKIFDHHKKVPDIPFDEYHHYESQCAAQIYLGYLYDNPPEHLSRLVEQTALRDLWQFTDERFHEADLLSVAAKVYQKEKLIRLFASHGPEISTVDKQAYDALQQLNYERYKRIDTLYTNSELTRYAEVDGIRIGVACGHPPDTSLFCHHFRRKHNLDVAAIIFPFINDDEDGHVISIRTKPETPIARDIAEELGGGGHPEAAGGNLSFFSSNSKMLLDKAIKELTDIIQLVS